MPSGCVRGLLAGGVLPRISRWLNAGALYAVQLGDLQRANPVGGHAVGCGDQVHARPIAARFGDQRGFASYCAPAA